MLPPFSILHFVQTFHSIMVVSFLFYETLNRQTAGGNRSENHPPSCDLCAANQHFSSVDFFRAHLQLASCNVSVKFKLSLCIFIDILNISQACFPGIFIAVYVLMSSPQMMTFGMISFHRIFGKCLIKRADI